MHYAFSRDLKVSLRPILGFGEYLLEGEVSTECAGQFQRKVLESAKNLEFQLNALADYAQLCRRPVRSEVVELSPLIAEVAAQRLKEQALAGECVELSGDIWPAAADAAMLRIVFSELLRNALQFVRPGQLPRVKVSGQRGEGRVEVAIADLGLGIPQACLPLLGRPFQRFHAGPEVPEGVGFGLTLACRGLAAVQGRLRCASEPGRGSTFLVSLRAA